MKNYIKKLPFYRNYTTEQHTKWWIKRKMDWKAEFATWSHPHRKRICYFLSMFPWERLMEVGSGSGANLAVIAKTFSGKKLCGMEVNKEAVAFANTKFKGAEFRECSAVELFATDKSTEIILTDMCLIYIGPQKIMTALKEFKRVATDYVILCEFDSKSWRERQWLRLRSGQHAYDYKKLLSKLNFYDIVKYKLTKEDWPESVKHHNFGAIIMAKIPKK